MAWICEGEKFALLGLNIEVTADFSEVQLPPSYFVLTDPFTLPDHWKGWLGSQRAEEIESCNAFLGVKSQAAQPGVLDGDDQRLRSLIGHWYSGLMLTGKFLNLDDPFIVAGSYLRDELDVRHFELLDPSGRGIVESYPQLVPAHLASALRIGQALEALVADKGSSSWRLMRCLAIYQGARNSNDILDRLHQFVRCIEGLIVSAPGKGKQNFKGRTELFIGPQHHDFMGDLYDMRGHIEHLHENQHLEIFDRTVRLEIARKEAVAEFIARTCLTTILLDPELRKHFANVDALRAFWQLDRPKQAALWGLPVDPFSPLTGFSFDHVTDHDLGRSQ